MSHVSSPWFPDVLYVFETQEIILCERFRAFIPSLSCYFSQNGSTKCTDLRFFSSSLRVTFILPVHSLLCVLSLPFGAWLIETFRLWAWDQQYVWLQESSQSRQLLLSLHNFRNWNAASVWLINMSIHSWWFDGNCSFLGGDSCRKTSLLYCITPLQML